jgi:hypothetical protein
MFSHLVLWGDTGIPADGTFVYCQLANSQIETWRPPTSPADGTFIYCAQDINQFDRTP